MPHQGVRLDQSGRESVVARQRFEAHTVRALAQPFADPRVGAVSGELMLADGPAGTAVGRGVGFYWRYEKHIRRCESRVDSTVGATGARLVLTSLKELRRRNAKYALVSACVGGGQGVALWLEAL